MVTALKLRYKIYLVLVVLGVTFGLGRCRRSVLNGPGLAISPAVLPKDDAEQIVVDPRTHTIIIKRPTGTTVTHLPDVQSVIDIKKDGTVKVTAPQWGWERRAFVGAGYSDKLRLGLGVDGLYWKALDLGVGVQTDSGFKDARVFVGLSYTVKDNMRLTLTYDHKQTLGALVTLRI